MSPRSRYLDYLPAVFDDEKGWLGRYLRGFEAVLTGVGDPAHPGLEELLDGIAGGSPADAGIERYFEPGASLPESERAPDDFLDWLAGWVALTSHDDVAPELQRRLIASAVELYGQRGTRAGLERLLALYTGLPASVADAGTGWSGAAPHKFHVAVRRTSTTTDLARLRRIVAAIVDAEKPAHTYYTLEIELPVRLQIGVTSRVGVETLLGGNQ